MSSGLQPTGTCSLSQLLPYDPNTKVNGMLQAGLKEYTLLLNATKSAINALRTGDLEQFDALVGENACQIRAVKVALLASSCLEELVKIEQELIAAREKIEELTKSLGPLMRQKKSLKDLLEGAEVSLSQDAMFLVESHILYLGKTLKSSKTDTPLFRNSVADLAKVRQLGDVSSSFAENLLRKLRQCLSKASVDFVREQASEIQDPTLIKMASEEFTISHNSWPCTPMFWTYKTLLIGAQKKEIPIVFSAKLPNGDEKSLLFKPIKGATQSYQLTIPSEEDLSMSAIIVQGVVPAKGEEPFSIDDWKTKIAVRNVDVILAGSADHRQYPDVTKEALLETIDDAEYASYKRMGKVEGFSSENPSTFFINHVYAARVGSLRDFI